MSKEDSIRRNRADRSVDNPARRQFCKTTASLAGGLAVAPGVLLYAVGGASAKPPDQAVSAAVRWGLLVDTTLCAEGCSACVTACNEEHNLQPEPDSPTDAQWIRKLTVRDKTTSYSQSFPVMCQHCETPPCVDVCPTGASFRRADGIVLVDKHTCIGCRYCMMACPYKARSFIHEALHDQLPHAPRGKGTVESCTLCVHKIDRGDGITACAEACERVGHRALVFGDLRDPNSEIAQRLREHGGEQIRADLGLNTGVRYRGIG